MSDDEAKWYVWPMKAGPFTLAEVWDKAAELEKETKLYTFVADEHGNMPPA